MSSTSREVPPDAAKVLQTFLEAGRRHDETAMRACLTCQSATAGNLAESGPSDGVDFELGEGFFEGESVIIPVKVVPTAPPADAEAAAQAAPGMEMQCIMVQEDGQWKFDLGQTMDRMMGGSVDAAFQEMANTMGEVMEGVGEAIGGAMREAFGEQGSSDSPEPQNWLEADIDIAKAELLPLSKMETLPKTQKAVREAIGSNVIFQTAMDDLLASMGSDERKVLTDWFDDQLFANWGAILAQVAVQVPLKGRLRAIRIENAYTPGDRFLAIDGSDLVYRIYLNDNSGYHNDDELATILPGVLAGLPEKIDNKLAGKRLIANDQEYPEFDLFQSHIVPRFMRRISERLGRDVALDLNTDEIYDKNQTTRQLQRWSLNRIYGGIVLAGQDQALNEAIKSDLKTIRIQLNSDVTGRNAKYEDGVLHVGIYHHAGEKGCFYEHEIARVLAGEPIEYQEPEQAPESDEETAKAEKSNAKNFKRAVRRYEKMKHEWEYPLEVQLEHPVELLFDFDSLEGRYERIDPFIQRVLTGTLQAIAQLAFDPKFGPRLKKAVVRVIIAAQEERTAGEVLLREGALGVRWPLEGDGTDPTPAIAKKIKSILA